MAVEAGANFVLGKGKDSLERRFRYGLTFSSYRAWLSFIFRGVAGFSGSTAAIPRVSAIEQHDT
jgi:hypothetical protein